MEHGHTKEALYARSSENLLESCQANNPPPSVYAHFGERRVKVLVSVK